MFGSRLKTWMENYIGRPKKKVQAEASKGKPKTNHAGGLILDSSESLAQSDTGISSGSQQVLSSCTTDYREGYSTATMDSDRSALVHCHTAVSLPSPESAYSTGYSTDGTSPGATAPPEYYINIRTGKHYFPSPAPTPTSPHSHAAFPNLHSARPCLAISCPPHALPRPHPRLHPPTPDTSALFTSRPRSHLHSPSGLNHPAPPHSQPLPTPPPPRLRPSPILKSPPKKTSPRAHYASLKLFLRSPKDTSKQKTILAKNKPLSPSKSKKWFKQPFQKFAHRRMDPCDDNAPNNHLGKQLHIPNPVSFLPAQDAAASPRQRNRIKTNPWLPRAPTSPHNFRPAFPLASLPRNRSCNNTPLQHRKSDPPPLPFQHPLDDSSGPTTFDSADRSDEDLTLNEMMGTYNESYVYEKETDILSDSDPTDCDDYDTDSDADNAGDERDSHDDELDFIDDAPIADGDDRFPPNTARCTYHHLGPPNKYPFLSNLDRRHSRKNSDHRRSLRKGPDAGARRERRKRGSRRCSKCEDEDNDKRSEGSGRKAPTDDSVGGSNLRRVLLKRVVAKNMSRSAEGSAVARRWGRTTEGLGGEGSPKVVVLLDEEADERYKELMEEADNIFQSLRNSPVIENRKKRHLLDGNDGRRDRSLETAPNEPDAMCRRRPQANDPGTPQRKSGKSLVLTLPTETVRKNGNKSSFKAKSSAHSPLDPLGPALRNFAVFTPAAPQGNRLGTSSSDDSDPTDSFGSKPLAKKGGAHYSSLVPIAFQSVVLGKPLASYCPQSEPVKRKIYSCSKTYDRLVKHLEEIQPGGLVHGHRPTKQQTHPHLPAKPDAPSARLRDSHPKVPSLDLHT